MTTFHFYVISQGFWGQNLEYKGGNVKGVGMYIVFGVYKALQIGIDHWTIGGLNFEFLLNFVVHVDGDFGSAQKWEFWESWKHL